MSATETTTSVEAAPHLTVTSQPNDVMRGAVVVELGKPLEIRDDLPIPTPNADQILVRITKSSLCMSDIAGWGGHVGAKPPFVSGHEPVGVVEEVGSSVRGYFKGDRVGFMPASETCQTCVDCVRGNHRFCGSKKSVGFNGMCGGFSKYCLADPKSTAKIPDGLSDEAAAPLLCAGVTAYAALKKVSLGQTGGTTINVVGSGGVGHLVIMYAKAMGYKVHAFDIAEDKLQLAKDSGADQAYNSMTIKDEEIQKMPSTIVVSGSPPAYAFAFKATQKSGRIIAVGVPPRDISVSVLSMILNELSLVATNQGTRQELLESLQIAADHGIKPFYELRELDTINEGYQDLIAGKVAGRIVYNM